MSFRQAVSLGGDCEPAHQLRRRGLYSVRGPFDWLVTPLQAFPRILADDGAQLGTRLMSSHGGTSVRCQAYDVLYHHEFPRDEQHQVVFSLEAIQRCQGKMRHKWESFAQACEASGPLLFLRAGPETDLPWDPCGPERQPVRSHDLNQLAEAIARRFPRLDFRVLALAVSGRAAHDFSAPLDPRVAVWPLQRRRATGWAADDADWDRVLDAVSLAGPGPGSQPAETLYWFDGAAVTEVPASAAVAEAPASAAVAAAPASVPAGGVDARVAEGRALWTSGRSHEAVARFAAAFAAGEREPSFVLDYLGLLTGETRYSEALDLGLELLRAGHPPDPAHHCRIAMSNGHAKLALALPRDAAIAAAEARERSVDWLDARGVLARAKAAAAEGRPLSLVRLGDGEARFLVAADPGAFPTVSGEEAAAMGEVVWSNWFGERLAERRPDELSQLLRAFTEAVAQADILGVCDATRLRQDTGHYGYLAAQEAWVQGVRRPRPGAFCTDAMGPRAWHEASPYLAGLLQGLDFVGVISPHPGLAAALQARFGIPQAASYDLPAEGRLPTAADTRRAGRHFPGRFREVLAELAVPRPGALFLVAGGLLGKIYCQRVKALGGVALDIGALADAWMGHDTRSGQMQAIAERPALAAAPTAAPAPRFDGALSVLRERGDVGPLVTLGRYLKAEARYADLIALGEAAGPLPPAAAHRRARVVGHARLALRADRDALVAAATARERSTAWCDAARLPARLHEAVRARRPFAFVRLGDLEARFLLAAEERFRTGLPPDELQAMVAEAGPPVFDRPLAEAAAGDLACLARGLLDAVRQTDVLGVADAAQLQAERAGFGYLALLEQWLPTASPPADVVFTHASTPGGPDGLWPFLRTVFAGEREVGLISLHPGQAHSISGHLGLAVHAHPFLEAALAAGPGGAFDRLGFPERFQTLLDQLEGLPAGMTYLVGGGLLGKVCCGRIKARGGVAIDIDAQPDGGSG